MTTIPSGGKHEGWEGVFPVVPTPLRSDYTPDLEGLNALIEFMIGHQVNGVTILGSNGEFPYFTFEEKVRIMKTAVKSARGRVKVLVGAGAMGTDETVGLVREAKKAGADATLDALPTYYPLSFPDVLEHYRSVSREDLPFFFYHFPDCTGLALDPGQVAEICSMDGCIGMKASVVSLPAASSYIRKIRKPSFHFFTGVTYLFRPALERGAAGLICPISAIFPEEAVGLYEAWKVGDFRKMGTHDRNLFRTLPLMAGSNLPWWSLAAGFHFLSRTGLPVGAGGSGSPAVFKEILRLRGLPILPLVRRPLHPLTEGDRLRAKEVLASLRRNGKNG